MADDEDPGLSVKTMVIGILVLVTYLCWAIAASAYFGGAAVPEGMKVRSGASWMVASVVIFLLNSLRLNHAPGIITNLIRFRPWLFTTWAILIGATVLFGLWVKALEGDLNRPAGKKRRRTKKKRRRKRRPIE